MMYKSTKILNFIIVFAVIVVLTALLVPSPVKGGLLLSPDQYKEGQCELVAKEYQRIYGGSLILIQPIKSNGAYDLGEYNGAWINKAWSRERGVYYIDYMSGSYFENPDDVLDWYSWNTGKNAELFNVNEKHPPFEIIWHY